MHFNRLLVERSKDFKLTFEALRYYLNYNSQTGEFTLRNPIGPRQIAGTKVGTVNNLGYLVFNIGRTQHRMHRLAWLYMTGEWPKGAVDHINGKKSDNRFSNLRDVEDSCNSQNRAGAQKNSKTGVLGVSPVPKRKGRFLAQIMVDKKQTRLGAFSSIESAQTAYLAAKRQYHPGFVSEGE